MPLLKKINSPSSKSGFKVPIQKRTSVSKETGEKKLKTESLNNETPKKKKVVNYGKLNPLTNPDSDDIPIMDKRKLVTTITPSKVRAALAEMKTKKSLEEVSLYNRDLHERLQRAISLKKKEIAAEKEEIQTLTNQVMAFGKNQVQTGVLQSTAKWLEVTQDALRDLHSKALLKTTIGELIHGYGLDPVLLKYDTERDDFL